MKLFKVKGIARRIAIGFLSIATVLFVSGMVSLFELSRLSNDTEDILAASKRNMEFAKDMLNAAHEQNRAIMHITVFGDHAYDSLCMASLGQLEAVLGRARQESSNSESFDSLSVAVMSLRKLTDDFYAAKQEQTDGNTLRMLAQPDVVWYDNHFEPQYVKVTEQIKDFMTYTQNSLAPRAAQLNKNAYRSVAPVNISLLVMIAVVLMLFYFVNIYCVRPIVQINRALGDYLAFRMPFNVKADLTDELRELKDKIDALINKIK